MWASTYSIDILFWLLFIKYCCCSCFAATDSLLPGQFITRGQTIVSRNGTFELGFFTRGAYPKLYLGIWYKRNATQHVVWVANRDSPLLNSSSPRLELSTDVNLLLLDDFKSKPIWSGSPPSSTVNHVAAVLLEDGNFVIKDASAFGSGPPNVYWQSFDYPTDTWLPGARLGFNRLTGKAFFLTSWKDPDDPGTGTASLRMDETTGDRFFTESNTFKRYWDSGPWNGHHFGSIPELSYSLQMRKDELNENEIYFSYTIHDAQFPLLSRIVMAPTGQMKQLTCFKASCDWSEILARPDKPPCGPFAAIDGNLNSCVCLPGFEPSPDVDERSNHWSSGCVRKAHLQCDGNSSVKGAQETGFWLLRSTRLPDSPIVDMDLGASMCQSACLEDCSCKAFAYRNFACLTWTGDLLNTELDSGWDGGQELYIRLALSELENYGGGKRKMFLVKILVPISIISLIASGLAYRFFTRKPKTRGNQKICEDWLSFELDDINSTVKNDEKRTSKHPSIPMNKDAEFPSFSFASVSAATDEFSEANKIGEGGFGFVYKGTSTRGHEIAVKRLSKGSRQGVEEFRNEIALIARLQHRNLVRLLGCCTEQDEKILIYEYLSNKSLDSFLFDSYKKQMLDWEKRLHIINGIAQGLLYLHEYSRLRTIHRDLKANNVLLDCKMNPKISDFGMARIFEGNNSEINTKRIVGTYGYMAPEYIMDGMFSTKSDVFSFGVLLLEIVSGKRNRTSYDNEYSLNLIGHAWTLWDADRALELLDKSLGQPPSATTLLRHINVGLLCVEEHPNDRPDMSNVVSMLGNELVFLPRPRQPAFCAIINRGHTASMLSGCSVNGLTVSMFQPR